MVPSLSRHQTVGKHTPSRCRKSLPHHRVTLTTSVDRLSHNHFCSPRCRQRRQVMGKWAKYSKRYKKEWENEANLKEWILAVEGDDSKAACKFCNNTLRAHHSDLMTHAATVKHKRNAGQEDVVKREGVKCKTGSRGANTKQEAVTVTSIIGEGRCCCCLPGSLTTGLLDSVTLEIKYTPQFSSFFNQTFTTHS